MRDKYVWIAWKTWTYFFASWKMTWNNSLEETAAAFFFVGSLTGVHECESSSIYFSFKKLKNINPRAIKPGGFKRKMIKKEWVNRLDGHEWRDNQSRRRHDVKTIKIRLHGCKRWIFSLSHDSISLVLHTFLFNDGFISISFWWLRL